MDDATEPALPEREKADQSGDPEIPEAAKAGRGVSAPAKPEAPGVRSFSLDSAEAYEALCPERDEPWIRNGSLPREPRGRDLPVIIEWRGGRRR